MYVKYRTNLRHPATNIEDDFSGTLDEWSIELTVERRMPQKCCATKNVFDKNRLKCV